MIDHQALDVYIDDQVKRHNVPGFALAIVQGGEITYARGFGVTSIESPTTPVSPDTIFCCGSISKSLTAVTVARLVDQGLLDLDQSVQSYLPWLTFSRLELAKGVTLRRLLSHSSGLFGTAGNFGPRDLRGLETCIRETIPLLDFVAPPGLVHEYSSLGIDLAGHVAEVVGGKYFPQIVQGLLLDPLEMQRSTYDRTVAMTYDVALPHFTDTDGQIAVQHRMFDYAAANPAGQAMASTLDLARFVAMLITHGRYGGRQIVSEALIAEMIRPQIPLRDAEGGGYGIGFYTFRYRGHRWITHAGLLTPYLCEISFLPDDGLGVIFQCSITNDFEPHLIRRRILDEFLGTSATTSRVRRVSLPLDRADLSRYTGSYFSLAAGFAEIREEGDHLVLDRWDKTIELYASQPDLFTDKDGTVAVGFVPTAGEPPEYFMLDKHAYCRFELDAAPAAPPSVLQSYVGSYRFDDGDAATVWLDDGGLVLSLSWLEGQYPCISLTQTKFASDTGLVEFRPGPDGVPALVLAGGIVANFEGV